MQNENETVADLATAQSAKIEEQVIRVWCGQLKRAYPLVDDFVSATLASGIDPDALLRPMLNAAIRLAAQGDCLGPNGDLLARRQIIDLVTEVIGDETGEAAANERDHVRQALIELLMCGLITRALMAR